MNQIKESKMEICNLCLFKYIVCQYLTNEQFERLYNSTLQLNFKKGQTILKQGNIFTHIVYLRNGMVKFHYEDESGKNLILTVVNSPALLGGANLFSNDVNIFSVTAVEDCSVCLIDISVLKSFVIESSGLAIRLVEFVSGMYKDAILNFVSLAHKQVNGRIADILFYLSGKIYKSNKFTLNLTRKELAEFAGCSQENVINTLSKFHQEKIIKSEGKNLEILDITKLRNISRTG